jgi:hypothetical protein
MEVLRLGQLAEPQGHLLVVLRLGQLVVVEVLVP